MKRQLTSDELQEILRLHKLGFEGDDKGVRADLRYADLSYADLRYADLSYADLSNADLRYAYLSNAYLRNADLSNAVGNMREVRSMQAEAWHVVWWVGGDDGKTPMMSIGCQQRPQADWWKFTDQEIAAMDEDAPGLWEKWRTTLKRIVTKMAPATPTGADYE